MSTSTPAEKTFTSFTKDQGANYAKHRRGWHPNLYKTIIDHHTSTCGQLNILLDVGCGPGTVAREFGPNFVHAIGIDPSEGMIVNARELGGISSTLDPVRFEIAAAEDLGSKLSPPIEDSSIDLITASTAAHWFDMSRFWPQAARVLKPGGTVAIFTLARSAINSSMPNAAAIQATLDQIHETEIKPFVEPGNILAEDLYIDLPLPWTLESPVSEFDEATYFRKEYSPDECEEEFYSGANMTIDLDTMEMILGTMSPIQRWRDAHPDTVGTEHDIVKIQRREIERLLHDAGVEKGKEVVQGSLKGVLMMAKKKA